MILTTCFPLPYHCPQQRKNRTLFLISVYLQILLLENSVSYISINQLNFSLIETIIPYCIGIDTFSVTCRRPLEEWKTTTYTKEKSRLLTETPLK